MTVRARDGVAAATLAVVLTACPVDPGGATAPERARLGEEFVDGFDDPASGWMVADSADGARIWYADDGAYHVRLPPRAARLLPAPVVYESGEDVQVSVSVERRIDHEGRTGGIWGLTCDFTGTHGYAALVQVSDGKGYPGIAELFEDKMGALVRLDRAHPAVEPDGVNDLELRCEGPAEKRQVTFTINDEIVAEATDDAGDPSRGEVRVGLTVDSSPLPKGDVVEIRFDDFRLERVD